MTTLYSSFRATRDSSSSVRKTWSIFLFVLVCHYCFYMTQLFPMADRMLEVAFFKEEEKATSTTTTTTTTTMEMEMGLVSCITTNRQSVLDVLVLAQNLHEDFDWGGGGNQQGNNDEHKNDDDDDDEEKNNNNTKNRRNHHHHPVEELKKKKNHLILEIYHRGILSRFLKGYLETTYPFVTVVNLLPNSDDDDDSDDDNSSSSCLTKALQTTKLKYVGAIASSPSPSIQFLQDPKNWLEKMKQQQQQQQKQQPPNCWNEMKMMEKENNKNNNKKGVKFVRYLNNQAALSEEIEEKQEEEGMEGICVLVDDQIASSSSNHSSSSSSSSSLIHVRHKTPTRTLEVGSIIMQGDANDDGVDGGVGEWISLDPSYSKVMSLNEFHREVFEYYWDDNNTKNGTTADQDHHHYSKEVDNLLSKHWHRQWEARRLIYMDRPVGWVPLDTGFHADTSSTMNTLSSANSSLRAMMMMADDDAGGGGGGRNSAAGTVVTTTKKKKKMINIDIALTADHQLVAVHNDKTITPFANFEKIETNNNNNALLPLPISKLETSQVLRITNPCLPPDLVRESLLPSPYQPYNCKPETISLASDIIEMVRAYDSISNNNNNNNKKQRQQQTEESSTEMILDLKAPTVSLQLEQARILARDVLPLLQKRQLAVRFFSVFEEDLLAATVIPEEALSALASDPSLEGIPYYVNVPSSVACHQITGWIQNQSQTSSFRNKMIQGCFIILGHEMIAQSWINFTKTHNVNTLHIPAVNNNNTMTSLIPPPKMICDVPRKENFVNPSLWDKEYNRCLVDGYDYIHDPFPPPSNVDTSPLSMIPVVLPNYRKVIRKITQRHLRASDVQNFHRVIHFGYGFFGGFDHWSPEDQFQWYKGLDPIKNNNHKSDDPEETNLDVNDNNFRCVSKALSVLLFLKFQEMGALDIDELVVDSNHTYPMTYRQVFSNTGGFDGTIVGEQFKYTNGLWPPIPNAFERRTGLRFVDAMNHYIIEPMGLQGFFDETNVTLPPYAARGYNGHPEDLVVLGGTLASGGVSPKTWKQIVSASSATTMLAESITSPSLAESFAKDGLIMEMDKVYNRTGDFPTGFVNGYAMGIWRVKGWRHTAQGLPIQGWLAQGSCMVYFDTTGLVVSFFPKGSFTASMVRSFFKMVRDWGDATLEKEGVREAKTAKSSRQLMAAMKMRKKKRSIN